MHKNTHEAYSWYEATLRPLVTQMMELPWRPDSVLNQKIFASSHHMLSMARLCMKSDGPLRLEHLAYISSMI